MIRRNQNKSMDSKVRSQPKTSTNLKYLFDKNGPSELYIYWLWVFTFSQEMFESFYNKSSSSLLENDFQIWQNPNLFSNESESFQSITGYSSYDQCNIFSMNLYFDNCLVSISWQFELQINYSSLMYWIEKIMCRPY